MTITILLVDDHHVVRQGLRALLEAQAQMEVIGEIDDGLGAVELVEKLQPRVVVLDLLMPGLNGREVTRRIMSTLDAKVAREEATADDMLCETLFAEQQRLSDQDAGPNAALS